VKDVVVHTVIVMTFVNDVVLQHIQLILRQVFDHLRDSAGDNRLLKVAFILNH